MNPQEVMAHLNQTEKDLNQAILSDFRNISYYISTDEFLSILEAGGEQEALRILEDMVNSNKEFEQAMIAAFIASGLFFTRTLNVTVVFDPLNPLFTQRYTNYKNALLLSLNTGNINVMSAVMMTGRIQNWDLKELQLMMARSYGLADHQWKAVLNYRQLLENQSLDALKRKLRDEGMDDTILGQFRQGKPLSKKQIDKLVLNYIEAQKNLRAKVISETESTRNYSMAQESVASKMVSDGVVQEDEVRRFWVNMRDERVRNSHKQTPYMNPEGRAMGEPFQTPLGPLLYPGDPAGVPANVVRCRCVLRYEFLS